VEATWSELAAMELDPSVYTALRPSLEGDGASFGLLTDLRGDVVGLVDAAGFVVERYDYDPYGARELRNATESERRALHPHESSSGVGARERANSNRVLVCSTSAAQACGSSYGNTQGYAGRFLSAFSGLYDMRARSYSPYLRQFVSPDPLGYGGGGFDLWSYANGDPVNLWDTWGLRPTDRSRAAPERGVTGGIGLLSTSSRPEPTTGEKVGAVLGGVFKARMSAPDNPIGVGLAAIGAFEHLQHWGSRVIDNYQSGEGLGSQLAGHVKLAASHVGDVVGIPIYDNASRMVSAAEDDDWWAVGENLYGLANEAAALILLTRAGGGNAAKKAPGAVGAEELATGGAGDALKDFSSVVTRKTRDGGQGVRLTRPDGSVIDITTKRVKEFVPSTHPSAPAGTLQKVKFPNAQPGTKGFKRDPTPGELRLLEEAFK
jgi:RHS repeat-associated protein